MTEQTQSLALDVVIFGGGIAGLWTLARLRNLGYQAVLLESADLGAGQTCHAQGIIHGGIKYALTGKLSPAAERVAAMPAYWRDCLAGQGELDLRGVQVNSEHQYLWSTAGLTSRMTGFFASRLMRSRTEALCGEARPAVFRVPEFKGQVYRLDEPVLDVASLIRELAEAHRQAIFKIDFPGGVVLEAGDVPRVIVQAEDGRRLPLAAKRLVLAAGQGNADLLSMLGRESPAMQLRPLHMVMLRGGLPGMLFAHCLGASAVPRITITSHRDSAGEIVWYLGGQLAEAGVKYGAGELIAVARKEMAELLPWLDLSQAQWATLRIDRAEPRQPDGSRPDDVFAGQEEGIITIWPTKLALAPVLANRVIALLEQADVRPAVAVTLPPWPTPACSPLPWQEEARWNCDQQEGQVQDKREK